MIVSVEKAKQLIEFKGWTDERIEMKLKSIEQTIRAYTNNNFQQRAYRCNADIIDGNIIAADAASLFNIGDTVQFSETGLNAGLYVIAGVDDDGFTVEEEDIKDEKDILVTKIVYPADVIDCALNLLQWEITNRQKVGIQSETLSRHSVTYFNMDGANQSMGYPSSLLGCLKAYRKARF